LSPFDKVDNLQNLFKKFSSIPSLYLYIYPREILVFNIKKLNQIP